MKILWIARLYAAMSFLLAVTSNPAMAADATFKVGQWSIHVVHGNLHGMSTGSFTPTGSIPGMDVYFNNYNGWLDLYTRGTPTTPGTYTLSGSGSVWVQQTYCPGDPGYNEDEYYSSAWGDAQGCYMTTTPTSESLSMTVEVVRPDITLSTLSQTSVSEGASYSQTITATGGTGPYTYEVTVGTLPAGMMLTTNGNLSGTPTTEGTYTFTVKATDSYNSPGSASYTVTVLDGTPAPSSSSATVAANSSANVITPNVTSATNYTVAIASAPAHGTASATGTALTYTPTAGYSGSDSFTYTATNASGTSAAATVSITVSAPTLAFSPAAGALSDGTVATAYSQTVTAANGTAPYSYAVTSGTLPAGLTLNTASGTISGTPTTAGSASFSITATDANGATGVASYSLGIISPAVTFVFSPTAGALPEAMAGEDYNQPISATEGVGDLVYSLLSGRLPKGMVLNVSTGELTGPLSDDTEGNYNFTIAVRDANGSTGGAHYTLKVKPRAVTVGNLVVNVPEGGAPPDVYLNRGATGGPFTSADLTYVEPANAGTAQVTRGQLADAGASVQPSGWYLQFTPNPAYSGQARVGFRLNSALGSSNTGTVTYNLRYDTVHVRDEIDTLVHDFVQTRQNLIASSLKVPGLLERRALGQSSEPVTTRMNPTEQGMTLGFSTSLAQIEASRDGGNAYLPAFNLWIDGALLAHHDKDVNGDKWGSFAMLSLGADYLVSDRALVGLSFHYDRMIDPTDEDAELKGNGWLAGPYASFEIGRNLFWNTSLLYGGSQNSIDTAFWDGEFDTHRLLADTSLSGQWMLDSDTVITPKLRAVYFSEKVEDYTVHNGNGDALTVNGFNETQFRVSLGAEIARSFTLDSGAKLMPKLGLTGGYSGIDGAGAFGAVTTGLSLQTADFWMFDASLLFNIEGEGSTSLGARVAASRRF